MQKKDDKTRNKTTYKKEGKKKRARKTKGNRFVKKCSNSGLCLMDSCLCACPKSDKAA